MSTVGLTTGQSKRFYQNLFKNDGKIVEQLERRNNGFSRHSYRLPPPPPKDLNEKEFGRPKHISEMTQSEIDDMEIYYRMRETDVRGNL